MVLKKVKRLKRSLNYFFRIQGSQGGQKMGQDPLNMPFEVWCANIAPKLKNIWKCLRKQVFFDIFFPILMVFWSLCLSGAILAHQTSNGMFSGSWRIFWHPWNPWGRIHIDLNKKSGWTGYVITYNYIFLYLDDSNNITFS